MTKVRSGDQRIVAPTIVPIGSRSGPDRYLRFKKQRLMVHSEQLVTHMEEEQAKYDNGAKPVSATGLGFMVIGAILFGWMATHEWNWRLGSAAIAAMLIFAVLFCYSEKLYRDNRRRLARQEAIFQNFRGIIGTYVADDPRSIAALVEQLDHPDASRPKRNS